MLKILISLIFVVPAFAQEKGAIISGRNIGRVAFVQGHVVVDGKEVKEDAPVREGTLVEVGSGKCTVLLGRDTIFQMARKTRVRISQYGIQKLDAGAPVTAPPTGNESASIDILGGRLRALVRDTGKLKKDYKIRSAGVVMGVRGTQLIIDTPQEDKLGAQTKIFTIEGKVELSNPSGSGGTTELKAGQVASFTTGATATPGAAGPPLTVATAEAKDVEAASQGMGLPFAAENGPPSENEIYGADLGDFQNFDFDNPNTFTDPAFNDDVDVNVLLTFTVQ